MPQFDLYLAGARLDADGLQREGEARRQAGLPSHWIGETELRARFGVHGEAALISSGAFAVDPIALTHGLLEAARQAGARLVYPADAVEIETAGDIRVVKLADGRQIRARAVVLATGYEQGAAPRGFRLGSTFAIASPPNLKAEREEDAMIWEASSPYLYMRRTSDGRLLAGGEDEDFQDPDRRDACIATKAMTLARKSASWLEEELPVDCAWAATFGASDDGFPGVGTSRLQRGVWLAMAYGGNGVAYAALAAEILERGLSGSPATTDGLFAPDRFGPP